jgi:hypothetical protein
MSIQQQIEENLQKAFPLLSREERNGKYYMYTWSSEKNFSEKQYEEFMQLKKFDLESGTMIRDMSAPEDKPYRFSKS